MYPTKISNIILPNYIMNASGCLCTTIEELNELKNNNYTGAIVSKSCTLNKRTGNEEPRLHFDDYGSINSMGIPNLGIDVYLDYIQNNKFDKPFILSVFPFDIIELNTIFNKISNAIKKSNNDYILIEINLSCPNITNKSIIGYEFEEFEKYLEKIKNLRELNMIIGIKLPPYYLNKDFDKVSDLLTKYKDTINFITCINSVIGGLMIDIEKGSNVIVPNDGYGGIGGLYCLPIGLANVRKFRSKLGYNMSIIGCGGISSGEDVYKYKLCGADAVQIGTHLYKNGLNVFKKINDEFINILNE